MFKRFRKWIYKNKKNGRLGQISEYYLKEMENEAKKAEKDLEEIYSKNNDEGAVKYIVRSQKSGYLNIFLNIYTNKIKIIEKILENLEIKFEINDIKVK